MRRWQHCPDDKDNLVWKWTKGAATEKQDFGTPLLTDDFWFCVYHGATPALVSRARIPAAGTRAGKPCWKENRNGFTYKKRDRTPHGVSGIVLKQGAAGQAKVVVKGKGTNLSLPTLMALTDPVVVQLKNVGNGQCWEATYGAPFVKQTTTLFKAKAD